MKSEWIAVKVTVCKCRYCGSQSVLINDYGDCPNHCPGYFRDFKDFMCEVTEEILKRNITKKVTP